MVCYYCHELGGVSGLSPLHESWQVFCFPGKLLLEAHANHPLSLFMAVSGGRSRLHLIDLGSCVKVLSKNREGSSGLCLSLSALGNVILALVNGSKHIPYK